MVAGFTGDAAAARAALVDEAPQVRSAAFGALSRLGALGEDDLRAGLADGSALVRRRACDIAGRSCLGGLAGDLGEALSDRAPSVVEAACYALGELGPSAVGRDLVAALSVTARSHPEALCREAAVAAIGALGDPSGLDAVLAAMGDKPAVRRRAAVALAAFEGPEAEQALARAAQDRDWQVRQVAEDLLFDRWPPGAGPGA